MSIITKRKQEKQKSCCSRTLKLLSDYKIQKYIRFLFPRELASQFLVRDFVMSVDPFDRTLFICPASDVISAWPLPKKSQLSARPLQVQTVYVAVIWGQMLPVSIFQIFFYSLDSVPMRWQWGDVIFHRPSVLGDW